MSRIALIGENSIEYVSTLLDIWNNGDCVVLIDWQVPIASAIQMMNEANVKKCFIERKIFDKLSISNNSIQFIPYNVSSVSAKLLPDEVRTKYHANYSKNEAVVIYSSGTTGKSRGIILSHYAITMNTDAIIDYMQPVRDDCIYTVRPFSHSSTFTGELLVSLRSGCNLLLAPTIVPPRYILGNIQKYGATILCVNPNLLSMLCNESQRNNSDLSSLRTIYSSGSILNNETWLKAKEIFHEVPIYNVYGLTEAGPRVSAQKQNCCNSNSVGKPISGVKLAIVSEDGKLLSYEDRGIVQVYTPSRYSGYISGKIKHDSLYMDWLNTGDVGYFDKFGELYIVDRIDDVIFLGAHKIYPNDVAAQIIKNADVDDCVVVMVHFMSEDILCCLYTAASEIKADIKNRLGSVLMKYEIPKIFVQADTIPRTRTGKVSLRHVREMIMSEMEVKKNDS